MFNEDKIQDYIHNRLDKSTRQKFEVEMYSDEKLLEKVEFEQWLKDSHETEKTKSVIGDVAEQYFESNTLKKRRVLSLYNYVSIAASIALLIFAAWWFLTPTKLTNQELVAKYMLVDKMNVTQMSANTDKELLAIESLYNKEAYQEVIPKFNQYLSSQTGEQLQLRLNLGIAYLKNKDYEAAKQQFESISTAQNLYTEQAVWYEALLELERNNAKTAKTLLQKLSENPAADFHKEAVNLLEAL